MRDKTGGGKRVTMKGTAVGRKGMMNRNSGENPTTQAPRTEECEKLRGQSPGVRKSKR